MSAADYLAGALLLAAVLVPTLVGALLFLRRRYGHLAGAERAVAYGALATLGLLAVHLVPLALGLLGRGSVLLLAVLWLAACALVPAASEPDEPDARTEPPEDSPVARYLAVAAVAAVAVLWLAFAVDQAARPPTSIDYSNFHMPDVAGWIQNGTLWNISSLIAYVAPGNYPSNGDVALLAFVLPWHNDFAAHVPMYILFALTGVAAYALALCLGAGRAAAAVAGALTCAIPAIVIAALTHAITDSMMLFGFVAGTLFLVRHHHDGRTSDLVLAGLALGLSFGTKWYAVSSVAILVGVWLVARLLARTGWRTVLRQTLAVSGLIALAGGIWLLRNWIESGNPVFPVRVAPLGMLLFDAPPDFVREQAGFTIFDYVGEWGVWKDWILPAFRDSLAGPALLIGAGSLLAAGYLAVKRSVRDRGVLLAVAAAVLLIAIAYVVTPYTAPGPEGFPVLTGANTRYVTPALVIGAGLAAWVCGRRAWGPTAFGALGLLAILHGFYKASRGQLSPANLSLADWVAGLAIAVAIAGLLWMLAARGSGRRDLLRSPVALPTAALLAAIAVAGGYEIQKRYNDDRFLGADPVLDAVVTDGGEDTRVGLTAVWTDSGISPVFPLFGERLDHEVEYVGPIERELQQRFTDRDAFVAALEEGSFDYLVVGRGRVELPPVQEGRWARSAGWSLVERSDRLDLYAPPA